MAHASRYTWPAPPGVPTHRICTLSRCRFSLYEPVQFIKLFLADKLEFSKVKQRVAVHVPCSSKKMGVSDAFTQLAAMCADEVVPSGVPCCGALAVPTPIDH